MKPLILASSSPARRQLLDRLHMPYTAISPDIDETPLAGEDVKDMVLRLAIAKAQKIASDHNDAIIIGADQVGLFDNTILCKPLTNEKAREQLRRVSNQRVRFYTAFCVLDAGKQTVQSSVETYDVHFRDLTDAMIDQYLAKESALQCAGSFRVEGLGMALVSKLEGDDYTSLIGLPLIKLIGMLDAVGVNALSLRGA